MKTHLGIAAILSAFVLVQCEFHPEFKKQVDECLKEFEFAEDVLKSPHFEDPKVNCFFACIMKKGDRLTEGKVSAKKEMELTAIYMPGIVNDSLQKKFADCVNIANEEKNGCAVAGAFYKCLYTTYILWREEE